jgi:hypothetical protein
MPEEETKTKKKYVKGKKVFDIIPHQFTTSNLTSVQNPYSLLPLYKKSYQQGFSRKPNSVSKGKATSHVVKFPYEYEMDVTSRSRSDEKSDYKIIKPGDGGTKNINYNKKIIKHKQIDQFEKEDTQEEYYNKYDNKKKEEADKIFVDLYNKNRTNEEKETNVKEEADEKLKNLYYKHKIEEEESEFFIRDGQIYDKSGKRYPKKYDSENGKEYILYNGEKIYLDEEGNPILPNKNDKSMNIHDLEESKSSENKSSKKEKETNKLKKWGAKRAGGNDNGI